MKGAAGRLYEEYISYYEARSHEGSTVLCDRQLMSGGDPPSAPGGLYPQIIRENLLRSQEERRAELLGRMVKGFAILELICVNLFLYPWRKEIRTLKKFTGNFIYFVEPVIPKDTVKQILQSVGYSTITDKEYIIGGTINIEEAKQSAFQLYLSRIQCEELIFLINEDRTDCVNLLFNGPNTERKYEKDNTGLLAVKSNSKVASVRETEGINNLHFKSKNPENINSNDSKKPDKFDLAATQKNSEDCICETSTEDLRHLDTDEFLNKYSDLNLAQQPIFALHNRQINTKTKELRGERVQPVVEPNIVKPHNPESFAKESESGMSKGRELAQDSKRPLMLNESPVEFNMPNKQGQSERLVIKLKMERKVDEVLAFPVEETLPPVEFPSGRDLCQGDPKWTFFKGSEVVDGVASPVSTSSGFSMLNATSKAADWSANTENLNRLREPPSSTYIPPGGAERQCVRITDIQPEENHFQAPSPPGDLVMVSETLYKINEDTGEDFVMISRKDNLQN